MICFNNNLKTVLASSNYICKIRTVLLERELNAVQNNVPLDSFLVLEQLYSFKLSPMKIKLNCCLFSISYYVLQGRYKKWEVLK